MNLNNARNATSPRCARSGHLCARPAQVHEAAGGQTFGVAGFSKRGEFLLVVVVFGEWS